MVDLKDDQVRDRSGSSTIHRPTPSSPEIRLVNHAWNKAASAWRTTLPGTEQHRGDKLQSRSRKPSQAAWLSPEWCHGEEDQRMTHWVALVALLHIPQLLPHTTRKLRKIMHIFLPHHRDRTCPSSEVQSWDSVSPFEQFLVSTFILKITSIDKGPPYS